MFKKKTVSVISDSGVVERKDILGVMVCIICSAVTVLLIALGVLACIN